MVVGETRWLGNRSTVSDRYSSEHSANCADAWSGAAGVAGPGEGGLLVAGLELDPCGTALGAADPSGSASAPDDAADSGDAEGDRVAGSGSAEGLAATGDECVDDEGHGDGGGISLEP